MMNLVLYAGIGHGIGFIVLAVGDVL